jgi:hypothetical protein
MIPSGAARSSALAPYALAALLSACSAPQEPPRSGGGHVATFPCAPSAPGASDADESIVVRDQPVASGLLAIGGKVVTRTSPPFEVDVDALTANPIPLPDRVDVLELASDGRVLWALGKDAALRLRLFERASSSWREETLPAGSRYDDDAARALAFDGEVLALLFGARLSTFERGRWSSRAVVSRRRGVNGLRALLHRRRLYLGANEGEFGGDLTSIDVDAGGWTVEQLLPLASHDLALPVRDVALGPDGALWVVRGLGHMGGLEGQLFRRDGGGWKLVASASGFNMIPDSPDPGPCTGDWNLPFTNFESIAFDAAGRVLLLTGTLGVVRREPQGGWTRLTQRWPRFVYADGLAVSGDKLVLGTFDAGPLVCEPQSGRLRRVPLTPPKVVDRP